MSTEPPLNFNSGRDNPPDDDFVAPSPLGHHVRADHGELRRPRGSPSDISRRL